MLKKNIKYLSYILIITFLNTIMYILIRIIIDKVNFGLSLNFVKHIKGQFFPVFVFWFFVYCLIIVVFKVTKIKDLGFCLLLSSIICQCVWLLWKSSISGLTNSLYESLNFIQVFLVLVTTFLSRYFFGLRKKNIIITF